MRLFAVSALSALLLLAPQTIVPAAAAPVEEPQVTRQVSTTEQASKDVLADLPAEVEVPSTAGAVQAATVPVAAEIAVAAVTLPASAEVEAVYLRPVVAGSAGEWTEVSLEEETGDSSGTTGTAPLVVSAADEVEALVVADTPVTGSLQVYSTAQTQSDTVASQYAQRSPDILSRAAWQADESLVRRAYTTGAVTGAVIHHTATATAYTREEVPGILRAIQSYHVKGRGWNDIAYNVLVDKYGRAWEGRGGGVTNTMVGGHAFGVTNYRTFGISLLGNYSENQPPKGMLTTMERIIAWKFRLHGVDPNGRTWGSSGQDGGSAHLPAIAGHRDENATSCPGDHVVSQMGTIRANVRRFMDTEFRDVQARPNPSRRIAGADRYSTAALVSERGFPMGASTAFLVTGRSFKDALAVAPWANLTRSPVLATDLATLPPVIQAELKRLNPSRIVIIGGPQAVSVDVENRLGSVVPGAVVERVAGANGYATSAAISAAAFPTSPNVLLASGDAFPDGLVGGPLAAGGTPILLAPAKGALPAPVRDEILRLGATKVTVLGGTAAVSETVVSALRSAGVTVERVAGSDRYATSVAVARRAFPANVNQVYLATGSNYPDALVSVGLQTAARGPLLLSPGNCLPPQAIDYLKGMPGARIIPIGGTSALPIDETFLPVCRA